MRAEHLRERRIALALEGQALDQADRQVRDLRGQRPQFLARKLHHRSVGGGDTGPLVNAGAEYFGPTDEIADMPIGQSYLAALRRGIKYPDAAALDQINSVMLGAL